MKFDKYNALGNDFIFFDSPCVFDSIVLANMALENEIGADGIVFTYLKEGIYNFDFYNKDGTSARICGNALRALAYHLDKKGVLVSNKAEVMTNIGLVEIGKDENGYYVILPQVNILSHSSRGGIVDCGNIHLITIVKAIDLGELYEIGTHLKEYLNCHQLLKIDDLTYAIVSYERGVGLTDSCISGTISAYSLLQKLGNGNSTLVFKTIGGYVYVSKLNYGIKASGKVKHVYKGELNYEFSE